MRKLPFDCGKNDKTDVAVSILKILFTFLVLVFVFYLNNLFAAADDKKMEGPQVISKRFVPLPQLQPPVAAEVSEATVKEKAEKKAEIEEKSEESNPEELETEEKCVDGVVDISGAPGCKANYTKCMPSGNCTMGSVEGTLQQQKISRHSASAANGCVRLSISQRVTCGCDGRVQSTSVSVESCSVESSCTPREIREIFSTGECSPDLMTKVLPSACGSVSVSESGGQISWENGCNEFRSESFSIPKPACQAVSAPGSCPNDAG